MPKLNNKNRLQDFLKREAIIESSGGLNKNHTTITDPNSPQYGDTAAGTYGLMPNTIRELQQSYKNQGLQDKDLESIKDMSNDEITDYINNNPEVEKKFAEILGNKVLNRMGGDEKMANYAWQYGHNLTPEKLKVRDYQSSDRAKKYEDLLKQQEPAPVPNVTNNVEQTPNEFDMGQPDQAANLKRLKELLKQYK